MATHDEAGTETGRPRDLVERDFTATAPDRLWVADLTSCTAWQHAVECVRC